MTIRHRHCAGPIILASIAFTVTIIATIETADARRGFRASFSAGRVTGSAAGSAVRGTSRVVRSVEETNRLKQVESRIDWSEVAKKGLEVVKTAFEKVLSPGSSSGSSSSAFTSSTLNPVELEACVRESKWLDDRSEEYDGKKARLDQQKSSIENASNEIDAARSRVNRSSQRSVDAFNARIQEHRRMVSYYNDTLLPDIRRFQDQLNARIGDFNRMCNGKSYYASDLTDVELKVGFKLTN